MYVELDHNLVARQVKDINNQEELPGREKPPRTQSHEPDTLLVKKYQINKDNVKNIIKQFEKRKEIIRNTPEEVLKTHIKRTEIFKGVPELEAEFTNYCSVLGTDEEVLYDEDWGLFGCVVACYNNHWILKTSPEDWWNVIVHTVARAVDAKAQLPNVRNFFVDHQGKKTIEIVVGSTLAGISCEWLFDQFSSQLRKNMATPGYVDLLQADFSTTTPDQLITSQIMIMASTQKYFNFRLSTMCGIPGLEMTGDLEDWQKLVEKLDKLEALLQPLVAELELEKWFGVARKVVLHLLDSYLGQPDKEWWGHILSWNKTYGSGHREWWSGWMPDFLMATGAKPRDFPSGVVAVPLHIKDNAVEDTGVLVAGIVGFTVEEGGRVPTVTAKHGWGLMLPAGSPVIPRFLAN